MLYLCYSTSWANYSNKNLCNYMNRTSNHKKRWIRTRSFNNCTFELIQRMLSFSKTTDINMNATSEVPPLQFGPPTAVDIVLPPVIFIVFILICKYVTVNLCNQGIHKIPEHFRKFAKSLNGLVNSQIPSKSSGNLWNQLCCVLLTANLHAISWFLD